MTLPPKLVESYKNGSFGIYIGAGMSRAAGLPDWKTFLGELIDFAKDNNFVDTGKQAELHSLISIPSNYLLVAEELKDILASDLPKYIKQKFDDKKLKPTDTLCNIVQLNHKFIITTNYDTLIEKAYAKVYSDIPNPLTYKNASAINYNILNNQEFILKAHGDAKSSPNEIILTEKDYRNIIFKEKGYQSVLHVLFSTCNILFLGASLQDPELKLLLGYIHNIFHGGSPDHFALINKDQITQTEKDRWRKDYNINVLTYDPVDNHKQIDDFIAEIKAIS
ncbi:SIR2 family NAD-dependent protein deacylase [Mucilaginibacter ginsenosidivorans]|uniref:SIR2 family protein n=1 Tax=Mucilaginibacter ginsenosidivorans TaxID=398053 RepID=A0A5B8USQ7_9SPHI|nr:SIR2 family protein [Mucilaginibacter ginsenosidivorans]QEC61983.1 SIR2 family protein [Mucilaginibacter ginsenosidivorans]